MPKRHIVALYPGSFDPFTNGHEAILRAAVRMFDQVVVAVGVHPTKRGLLDREERIALVEACIAPIATEGRISVARFDGLVVDAAREAGATALVRGLRDGTDLDYEFQMAGMNGAMLPELHTVFLPATPETRHITATLVRQIAAMGGDVSAFVPAATLAALRARSS